MAMKSLPASADGFIIQAALESLTHPLTWVVLTSLVMCRDSRRLVLLDRSPQGSDRIATKARLKHARKRIPNPRHRRSRFRHRSNSVNDLVRFGRERHFKDFFAQFRVIR